MQRSDGRVGALLRIRLQLPLCQQQQIHVCGCTALAVMRRPLQRRMLQQGGLLQRCPGCRAIPWHVMWSLQHACTRVSCMQAALALTWPAPIGRMGCRVARSTSTSLSGPERPPLMCDTGINTRPFCSVLTSLLAPMALSTCTMHEGAINKEGRRSNRTREGPGRRQSG